MVDAKLTFNAVQEDKEMERTAWFTSLIMSAGGNYGKKGIEPKKLYERVFDNDGNIISKDSQGAFTPIDKEIKDKKLNELMKKFNM